MKEIDMTADKRRKHFEYFQTFANPYTSVTVPCDITPLKDRKPFFLHLLYCAVRAANSVPELRRRIVGGRVVEYESRLSSHTVALADGTYCYCELDCDKPLAEFLPYAQAEVERAKQSATLDEEDADRLFFVTSLPWLSFTAISLPTPVPPDSNPRITFGKAYEQNGRYLVPVNLTVNHALVDGRNMADFFLALEENCRRLNHNVP